MEGFGHVMFDSALGDAEFLCYLAVAHAVALGHEKNFAATVGQGIDGRPEACGHHCLVHILLLYGQFAMPWAFQRQYGLLSVAAQLIDTAVAHDTEEVSSHLPLRQMGNAGRAFQDFHEAILHDVLCPV